MVKAQELTALRAEFKEAKAVTPPIPVIKEASVPEAQIKTFIEEVSHIYPGLQVVESNSKIMITSSTTSNFGQFREALAHVYNGGSNWRVSLDRLCVGRECDQKHKLAVALSIKQVSVENPNK